MTVPSQIRGRRGLRSATCPTFIFQPFILDDFCCTLECMCIRICKSFNCTLSRQSSLRGSLVWHSQLVPILRFVYGVLRSYGQPVTTLGLDHCANSRKFHDLHIISSTRYLLLGYRSQWIQHKQFHFFKSIITEQVQVNLRIRLICRLILLFRHYLNNHLSGRAEIGIFHGQRVGSS